MNDTITHCKNVVQNDRVYDMIIAGTIVEVQLLEFYKDVGPNICSSDRTATLSTRASKFRAEKIGKKETRKRRFDFLFLLYVSLF